MKTLDEAKAILANGGELRHEGIGETLKVWIEAGGEVASVDRSDFRPLAEFARELKAEYRPARPEPIIHVRTLDSAAIHSYGYCPERQVFEVRYKFKPTVLYRFAQVPPEVHEAARLAESIGRFISTTFPKGQTMYPMTKEDDAIDVMKEAS